MTKYFYPIVGCHRSGTSATAGALAALGAVDFGDNLMPPSPANPKGYFEDRQIVALHDRLLAAQQRSWENPPDDGRVIAGPARIRAVAEIEAWFDEREDSPAVGVKDPRLTFYPDVWLMPAELHARRLFVPIVVQRDAHAIAGSLCAREGWGWDTAMDVVESYEAALDWWIEHPNAWVVNYDDMLHNPQRELGRIFGDGDWDAVERFLDPRLNHHA